MQWFNEVLILPHISNINSETLDLFLTTNCFAILPFPVYKEAPTIHSFKPLLHSITSDRNYPNQICCYNFADKEAYENLHYASLFRNLAVIYIFHSKEHKPQPVTLNISSRDNWKWQTLLAARNLYRHISSSKCILILIISQTMFSLVLGKLNPFDHSPKLKTPVNSFFPPLLTMN